MGLALAGIQVSFYEVFIAEHRWMLIVDGLWATVVITILSLLMGTLLGGLVYLLSLSKHRWMREVAKWWKVIVRGTPMLVLLLIFFYVILGGHHGIVAAVAAFSINFSNLAASLFQSSIDSVGRNQIEAGRALGFSNLQTMRYIVAPQAIRNALPAYKYQSVTLLKSTSIVGYVALLDLTQATELIRTSTGENLLSLLVVTVIYFLLAWLLNKLLDSILVQAYKI